MGRTNKNNDSNFKPGICNGATLHEEKSGKKHADVSLILKMKHLQKLAAWAGGVGISPLGALFGYQLAANAETSGVPLDQSSFYCRRCESILQPGFNCTIRIEKCKNKKRKRSKETPMPSQNNVVYTCNFCYHRNVMKGTTKGHVKTLLSSRPSTGSELASGSKQQRSLNDATIADNAPTDEKLPMPQSKTSFSSKPNHSITVGDLSAHKTPLRNSAVLSSDSEARRLQFSRNDTELSGSCKGSAGRRKRKTWSSLKDIVERKDAETGQSISKLVIPFYM